MLARWRIPGHDLVDTLMDPGAGSARAGLEAVDRELKEAARVLGVWEAEIFFSVSLPRA